MAFMGLAGFGKVWWDFGRVGGVNAIHKPAPELIKKGVVFGVIFHVWD
jgi:hypothetical protein